jgi:CyaY protein
MNEAQFNQRVDDIMYAIEETIDDSGADMDYENSGGMLTITCEGNGSQIILSRQAPLKEIWLAARSGGFHFSLQNTEGGEFWLNTVSGEPLVKMLSEACLAQSGAEIIVMLCVRRPLPDLGQYPPDGFAL